MVEKDPRKRKAKASSGPQGMGNPGVLAGHVLDMLGKGEQREFTTVVGVVGHGKGLENGWTTLKSVYSSLFSTEIVCFLIYWGGVMYASYYPLLCDDIV